MTIYTDTTGRRWLMRSYIDGAFRCTVLVPMRGGR